MYTDGQIINKQEHSAFANWNNTNGNKFRSESRGDGTYKIVEVVISEPTIEEKQEGIRSLRNHYLNETDKVFMPDFPIDMAGRESYKLYRQYLRDYTQFPDWWESKPLKYEDWVLQSEK